jgi:hypothetical protein
VPLDRRTYSPVLRQADIPEVGVPSLGERLLRFDDAGNEVELIGAN